MRYIKTDWYQWRDTHASLLVQVDWHRLLVPENWSVCMVLMTPKDSEGRILYDTVRPCCEGDAKMSPAAQNGSPVS